MDVRRPTAATRSRRLPGRKYGRRSHGRGGNPADSEVRGVALVPPSSRRPIPSTDPLHWTGSMQNWDFMCSECHSTGVQKGDDAQKDNFTRVLRDSRWLRELPRSGRRSSRLGARRSYPGKANKGFDGSYARREKVEWIPDAKTGSPTKGAPRPAADEVELCAHCHSRRGRSTRLASGTAAARYAFAIVPRRRAVRRRRPDGTKSSTSFVQTKPDVCKGRHLRRLP